MQPTPYYCRDKQRRQAVRDDGTLNGIDYLELADDEPTTLQVHCLNNLPNSGLNVVTARNVQIAGGVSIRDIRVVKPVKVETKVLTVHLDKAGDFSTYRLRLVGVPNFDHLLSEIEFSFKVGYATEFDCLVEPVRTTRRFAAPPIDYLSKDYTSFRQLMLDRLSVIMPDWQERSPADLGVTLVELLAYAGDRLSYFQDAVATEAYLGTARRRVSIRRHARLLDYPMHDGCNSRAWIYFNVNADTDLAKGTQLLTTMPGPTVLASSELAPALSKHGAEIFEVMHDVKLHERHNEIEFHTWGNSDCCLPKGATRATLKDKDANEQSLINLQAGDVLIFEEVLGPLTGDADPNKRHAVRLTAIRQTQDPVGGRLLDPPTNDPTDVVEIEWAVEDALPFPLCISTGESSKASVARGNVALADHGRQESDELPQPSATPNTRSYRPQLRETGVTFSVPYDPLQPAAAALAQRPQDALPDIELKLRKETWTPRRDLLESGRFDPHFVVETEDDGRAALRFSRPDDPAGKTPAAEASFTANYRVGNGTQGNVAAETISHVVVPDTDKFQAITAVSNPLPAQGGTHPESIERVRLDAPQAYRVQERAVTEQDYAAAAERHSEVQKAVATRRWTGSWHTMFMTVDRRGGLPVDAMFQRQLLEFLERFRLAGHDLEIDPPDFVPVDIVMTVQVAAGHFSDDVQLALRDLFSDRELPDGRRGFFHPDNFTFGQSVYLSQLIAAAMGITGVEWVDLSDELGKPNRFRRWGQLSRGEYVAGRIEMGRLEIALLNNDPRRPRNGKIEFLMEGGA